MICVLCPTGCRLRVVGAPGSPAIKGAACARGREYAVAEVAEPMRTFTGTVPVVGGDRPVVSVKSDRPVPRQALVDVARLTARLEADAPVSMGDVLAADLPNGASLVATANVGRR